MAALLLPLIAEGFFDGPELADLAQLGLASVYTAVRSYTGDFARSRADSTIRRPENSPARERPPRIPIAFSIGHSVGAKAYALCDPPFHEVKKVRRAKSGAPSFSSGASRSAWAVARLHANRPPVCSPGAESSESRDGDGQRHAVFFPEDEPEQWGALSSLADEAKEAHLSESYRSDMELLAFGLAARGAGHVPDTSFCWIGVGYSVGLDFLGYALFPRRAACIAASCRPEPKVRDAIFRVAVASLVAGGMLEAARKLIAARATGEYRDCILLGALIGRDGALAADVAGRMLEDGTLEAFVEPTADADPRFRFYSWAARMLVRAESCRPHSSEEEDRRFRLFLRNGGGRALSRRRPGSRPSTTDPGAGFPRLYAELICGQPSPCHVLRELERMGFVLDNTGEAHPLELAQPFPLREPDEVRALADTDCASRTSDLQELFLGSPTPFWPRPAGWSKKRG